MLSLSAAAIVEKNVLANTGAWILLLEITLPDTTVIRVCNNTSNIVWPTGTNTWTAFPFELQEMSDESKNVVPAVTVRVGNASRAMQAYMEAADGGVDSDVRILLVHSAHLDLLTAEVEYNFKVIEAHADNLWATFVLGASNPYNKRFPRNRCLKNFCRYKVFKGDRCGYAGIETACDRTLTRCIALANNARFGGFPGLSSRGRYY